MPNTLLTSSWPGRPKAEFRPSTSCDRAQEDVDGRDKPGHDKDCDSEPLTSNSRG
jgi:hypothetical protein